MSELLDIASLPQSGFTEVVHKPGWFNYSGMAFHLDRHVFSPKSRILKGFAIDRSRRLLAVATSDSDVNVDGYVFADNISNDFFTLKRLDRRRDVAGYELSPVSFLEMVHGLSLDLQATGYSGGCSGNSDGSIGGSCSGQLRFNWPTSGEGDPLSWAPAESYTLGPLNVRLGAYLQGGLAGSIRQEALGKLTADVTLDVGGVVAFGVDLTSMTLAPAMMLPPFCIDIPLPWPTSFTVFGISVGVVKKVCAQFGMSDVVLAFPQDIHYERRATLVFRKTLRFSGGALNAGIPHELAFSQMQDSEQQLATVVELITGGTLSVTTFADVYGVIGLQAGSLLNVVFNAGVRGSIRGLFGVDTVRCTAPWLYGNFTPAVDLFYNSTGASVNLPILGPMEIMAGRPTTYVRLWPAGDPVVGSFCLLSPERAHELNVGYVSAPPRDMAVFRLSSFVGSSTGPWWGTSKRNHIYWRFYTSAAAAAAADGANFEREVYVGAFQLTGSGSAITLNNVVIDEGAGSGRAYRIYVMHEVDWWPDYHGISGVFTGGSSVTVSVQGVSTLTLTVSFSTVVGKRADPYKEATVGSAGSVQLDSGRSRNTWEIGVIEHSQSIPYRASSIFASTTKWMDNAGKLITDEQVGTYKDTLPMLIRVVSCKQGASLVFSKKMGVDVEVKSLSNGATALAGRFVTNLLNKGTLYTAAEAGVADWSAIWDPVHNDLRVTFGIEGVGTHWTWEWISGPSFGSTYVTWRWWVGDSANPESELTLSFTPVQPTVAYSGLSSYTDKIVAPVYLLSGTSATTITVPGGIGYGILKLSVGLRDSNRLIMALGSSANFLTPLLPHRWLEPGIAVVEITSADVNTERSGVAIPFRVTAAASWSRTYSVRLQGYFRGTGDTECRTVTSIAGTAESWFGCIDGSPEVSKEWKGYVSGTSTPVVALYSYTAGNGWKEWEASASTGTASRTFVIVRSLWDFPEGAPTWQIPALQYPVEVNVSCPRCSMIGQVSDGVYAPIPGATWDEWSSSVRFLPGIAETQRTLYAEAANSSSVNALSFVTDNAPDKVFLLTTTCESGIADLLGAGTGTPVTPGVHRLIYSGRSTDAALFHDTEGDYTRTLLLEGVAGNLEIRVERADEGKATLTPFLGNQQIAFSWDGLLGNFTGIAEVLGLDIPEGRLPEDASGSIAVFDGDGKLVVEEAVVLGLVNGTTVGADGWATLFDIPVGQVSNVTIKSFVPPKTPTKVATISASNPGSASLSGTDPPSNSVADIASSRLASVTNVGTVTGTASNVGTVTGTESNIGTVTGPASDSPSEVATVSSGFDNASALGQASTPGLLSVGSVVAVETVVSGSGGPSTVVAVTSGDVESDVEGEEVDGAQPEGGRDSSVSAGAVAGGAVGGVAALTLTIIGVWYKRCRDLEDRIGGKDGKELPGGQETQDGLGQEAQCCEPTELADVGEEWALMPEDGAV